MSGGAWVVDGGDAVCDGLNYPFFVSSDRGEATQIRSGSTE